jgi:HlyD family secretion protein
MDKKKITIIVTSIILCVCIFWMVANAISGTKNVSQSDSHLMVQSNVEMTDTNINTMIGGKVKEISVKEGDNVKAGQVLITIDSDTLNAQISQAKARIEAINTQIDSAKAAKELADTTYSRVKTLYNRGLTSKADFDNASTHAEQAASGLQTLYSQLNQAQAGLQEVTTHVNKTTITAPTTGVITQLNVEVGELVSTGMPLIVITDQDKPWVECDIKETDLAKVHLGQIVSIKLAAYKGQTFAGKVVRINKNADFAVKRATTDNGEFDIVSYGVKVEFIHINQPLYAGMTAFVDFSQKRDK